MRKMSDFLCGKDAQSPGQKEPAMSKEDHKHTHAEKRLDHKDRTKTIKYFQTENLQFYCFSFMVVTSSSLSVGVKRKEEILGKASCLGDP